MRAGQHVIDEGPWVHQFQVDAVLFRPAMQGNQEGETTGVKGFDLGEIEHEHARQLLG
jgi:hypothetical protein